MGLIRKKELVNSQWKGYRSELFIRYCKALKNKGFSIIVEWVQGLRSAPVGAKPMSAGHRAPHHLLAYVIPDTG